MSDLDKLSADKILAIDVSEPEKLFSLDDFDRELRKLHLKWHPDRTTDEQANDVFVHITKMADIAKERIASDTWRGNAVLKFTTSKDKQFKFKYRALRDFELGKMYIGTSKVVYVIDEANKDLFNNGVKAIKGIKYPKTKFKNEFSKLLPNIVLQDKTSIGYVLVMDKPEGTVLLQDLIDHMPDKVIDPKHVAWIVGSLYNITTFLDCIGVTHNSILPSTLFVDPEMHSVHLLGGWWYSTKAGDKLKAIPTELKKVLPKEVFDKKIAKSSYDRLAVKGTAIGCLGDPSLVGSKLLLNKDVPKPMLSWLRAPSSGSALEEFKGWDETLIKSFGKRKFIKLDVNINDIY